MDTKIKKSSTKKARLIKFIQSRVKIMTKIKFSEKGDTSE